MDEEVASLKEAVKDTKTTMNAGMDFCEGLLDGEQVVIVKCGICHQNGIPFVIIRAISDKADGSAQVSYAEFEQAAAAHCAAITRYMISRGGRRRFTETETVACRGAGPFESTE